MTEPRTEAGKRLLGQIVGEPVFESIDLRTHDEAAQIAAIEAEATAAAERRLRERIEALELYDANDRITAINGTVREPRTMADATEAYRARLLALLSKEPE